MFWRIFLFFLFCGAPAAAQPDVRAALQESLGALDDGGQSARFYALYGFRLAWSGGVQAEANARMARAVMDHAEEEGLDPNRYGVFHSGQAAADDVALTTAVLAYMRDLAAGRPDLESLDPDVALPPRDFDAPALLDDALRHGRLQQMLAGLPPAHAQYQALRRALAATGDPAVRGTIAANMERWRWLPAGLEPNRIEVNAATAELTMWLGGELILKSRVIVGKPATRTPILRAEGAGITVNPAWNVPHSIAVKEILPKLKRNRGWLASEDMVLLDGPPGDPHGLTVNWRAIPAGRFPYRIRQAPGARNPLGQIKLELPNRFDVYLHDTPGKTAFERPRRAPSHGCIRVEQILPLASYALTAGPGAVQAIQDAIGQGQTHTLPLNRKVPVYVLYWTAIVGDSGDMTFTPDLYGRDRRLVARLRRQPVQVAAYQPSCRKA